MTGPLFPSYIVTDRDGGRDPFFKHENHPYLLFGERGRRKGKKPIHQHFGPKTQEETPGSFELECRWCCVVNPPPVTGITTFDDYASGVFVPPIEATGNLYEIDVGLGRYPDNSIKKQPRERGKRGTKEGGRPDQGPRQLARFSCVTPKQGRTLPVLSEKIVPQTFPDGKQVLQIGAFSLQWHDPSMPPVTRRGRHKNCGPSTRCLESG
ncbi:hypothetical protein GWK47_046053 [Chionoecetes opilio]|uniref:Uncharacterized protein n=1 Tax=Chionoecetes opilio TaxID=41210 RepID=A0A8J4Y6L8_CHIOP|nr:hypothetical protein GWK47_046053 [Chionoecetes opilio]